MRNDFTVVWLIRFPLKFIVEEKFDSVEKMCFNTVTEKKIDGVLNTFTP